MGIIVNPSAVMNTRSQNTQVIFGIEESGDGRFIVTNWGKLFGNWNRATLLNSTPSIVDEQQLVLDSDDYKNYLVKTGTNSFFKASRYSSTQYYGATFDLSGDSITNIDSTGVYPAIPAADSSSSEPNFFMLSDGSMISLYQSTTSGYSGRPEVRWFDYSSGNSRWEGYYYDRGTSYYINFAQFCQLTDTKYLGIDRDSGNSNNPSAFGCITDNTARSATFYNHVELYPFFSNIYTSITRIDDDHALIVYQIPYAGEYTIRAATVNMTDAGVITVVSDEEIIPITSSTLFYCQAAVGSDGLGIAVITHDGQTDILELNNLKTQITVESTTNMSGSGSNRIRLTEYDTDKFAIVYLDAGNSNYVTVRTFDYTPVAPPFEREYTSDGLIIMSTTVDYSLIDRPIIGYTSEGTIELSSSVDYDFINIVNFEYVSSGLLIMSSESAYYYGLNKPENTLNSYILTEAELNSKITASINLNSEVV